MARMTLRFCSSESVMTTVSPRFKSSGKTSANSSVASVAKSDTTGVVTGLAVGETQVLATVGNVIAHISVNVVP